MNNQISQSTIRLTSRQVSLTLLEDLSAIGTVRREKLISILQVISRDLQYGSSAAKAISKSIAKIESFLTEKDVKGSITEKSQRKICFELSIPVRVDELLGFNLIRGELNGRSGSVSVTETCPVKITVHALQRLLERVSNDNDAVLAEVHDSLKWAPAWNSAGIRSNAQCWPILSPNGFFVAAPSENSSMATVLTWMRKDTLSRKWGVVYDNLSWIGSHNIELMEDEEFAMEFIASFPWMLREHIPGEDLLRAAWESRQFERQREDNPNAEIADHSKHHLDDAEAVDCENGTNATTGKTSVSYVPGLNYQNIAPEFKAHSRHFGVVVQKQRSGKLVVSLKNSWFGELPHINSIRSNLLEPGSGDLNVGDPIEVEVKKIAFIENEQAYAVFLESATLADANWKKIEDEYPIGANAVGEIFAQVGIDCAIRLPNGVRGLVHLDQVLWFLAKSPLFNGNVIGSNVDLLVSEYRPSKRNLVFEVPGYKQYLSTQISDKYHIGLDVSGTVVRRNDSYALIKLDDGICAILNRANCWGAHIPEMGERVSARVIQFELESEEVTIGLHAPQGASQEYFSITPSDDSWANFLRTYSEGQKVTVQALDAYQSGYLVAMSDGYSGLLHFKDVSWSANLEDQNSTLKIGDVFDVVITKISAIKKRINFSRRDLAPHPMDVVGPTLKLNDKVSGVVVSALDYGYFIRLPSDIEGLLHRSNVPSQVKFEIGDTVNAYVNNVDLERRRLSLSLTPTSV